MIKVSVLGSTGYTGIELVRLLTNHPNVQISHLVSHSYTGKKISEVYPSLAGIVDTVLEDMDTAVAAGDSDIVFTALPHGASKEVIPKLIKNNVKVIDLSGDYRYNNAAVYEQWYGEKHSSAELLDISVYGLCELHRDEIKKSSLIGNPGCYTTCSILALYPLVKSGLTDNKSILIDAKSGVTGAGRALSADLHFCECTENAKAYKIATHRHTSEIEQELSLAAGTDIMVSFTPHLIPVKRGILATCYANLTADASAGSLIELYREFYKNEPFVRIYDEGLLPETNHVAGSNFADIGIAVDKRLGRAVVVSCIDNLIKGAAGQAIQNMNIMFGLEETTGLYTPGFYL